MEEWKTIIKPKTGILDIPLGELWQYRGLIFRLVKRNYEVQYKQTILGPLWLWGNLILSSGLFSFVFGYVGKFSSDGIPYFLFYMSASVLWNFFNGCVINNTQVLLNNAYLFGKVYFPRLVVPAANGIFELMKAGIQLLVFAVVWLIYFVHGDVKFHPVGLLVVLPCAGVIGLLGISLGLLISSLTAKYRDLSHLVTVGMQILMYLSPVLYPVTQLPDTLQKIVMLNPIASLIEAFRFGLTGSGSIHWGWICYSLLFTAGLSLISLILFNQTEKTFIDII